MAEVQGTVALEVDGVSTAVAYHLLNGPPYTPCVVLMHTALGTGAMMSPVADAIRGEFGILMYDRRGHGASSPWARWPKDYHDYHARELLALLEALGLRNVLLCGCSDGSTVGVLAAAIEATRPVAERRIAGMLLTSPHVRHSVHYPGYGAELATTGDGAAQEGASAAEGGDPLAMFGDEVAPALTKWANALDKHHRGRGREVLARWLQWWTAEYAKKEWLVPEATLHTARDRLDVKVHVMHGTEDQYYPVEESAHCALHLGADLTVVDGGAHQLYEGDGTNFVVQGIRVVAMRMMVGDAKL